MQCESFLLKCELVLNIRLHFVAMSDEGYIVVDFRLTGKSTSNQIQCLVSKQRHSRNANKDSGMLTLNFIELTFLPTAGKIKRIKFISLPVFSNLYTVSNQKSPPLHIVRALCILFHGLLEPFVEYILGQYFFWHVFEDSGNSQVPNFWLSK